MLKNFIIVSSLTLIILCAVGYLLYRQMVLLPIPIVRRGQALNCFPLSCPTSPISPLPGGSIPPLTYSPWPSSFLQLYSFSGPSYQSSYSPMLPFAGTSVAASLHLMHILAPGFLKGQHTPKPFFPVNSQLPQAI